MGRKVSGSEAVQRAKHALSSARTADELRTAQAVLLPLEFGLTIEQTASAMGTTPSWVARARRSFINSPSSPVRRMGRGGRRNALLSADEEVALVKRAVVLSNHFNAPSVRQQLEKLLLERGLQPSPSTITAMMQRTVDKFFPGQKASYLSFNIGPISHLWSDEVYRQLKQDKS